MFYPKEQLVQVPHPEAELIRDYGSHTLAFFGLAPENLHFLAPSREGLVNYRLTSNVAVMLGDAVCAPQACEQVTQSFLDFCALHDWQVAFYQASSEHLATYRARKLREFKMGEEAIIHLQTFTLRDSALANVRTSCRRAEREGVVIHLHLLESRQTLFNFKQKFHPGWESRYIVINSTLALPKIVLAVLRLRNYSRGGLMKLIKSGMTAEEQTVQQSGDDHR